jgi:hypothetical protein
LEIAANEAFDTYREMYYEGGVSSVYAFDIDEKFGGIVVLIKKGEIFIILLSRTCNSYYFKSETVLDV